MAKRFTDSDKWRKPWFRALSWQAKFVWTYLIDNCDHAGIWPASFDLLSGDVGFEVTEAQLAAWYGDKVLKVDSTKFFIPGYVEFQYGELKSDSKPHMSVIKILEKNGIDPKKLTLSKGYRSSTRTTKDKDKDKDQAKAIDLEFKKLSEKFRKLFPGSTTGPKASERFAEQMNSPEALASLDVSLDHYRKVLDAQEWRAPKTTFEIYLGTKQSGFFWQDFIQMPELLNASDAEYEAKERAIFERAASE